MNTLTRIVVTTFCTLIQLNSSSETKPRTGINKKTLLLYNVVVLDYYTGSPYNVLAAKFTAHYWSSYPIMSVYMLMKHDMQVTPCNISTSIVPKVICGQLINTVPINTKGWECCDHMSKCSIGMIVAVAQGKCETTKHEQYHQDWNQVHVL